MGCQCSTAYYSTHSEAYAPNLLIPQTLQNGYMLSFGESSQEIIHLLSGTMEEACSIELREIKETGFLYGKMGFVIFASVKEKAVNARSILLFSCCRVVGKVASDYGHKWVYRDSPKEIDPNFISSWNMSIDPQPRAWEAQFSSGIETIAIISVKEGAVQLGSFDKVGEDLNMVMSIQRKLSYIQSLPGIHALQRPYQPIQDSNFPNYNNSQRLIMQNYEIPSNGLPTKSILLGYNLLHSNGNLGALFTNTPFVQIPYCGPEGIANILQSNNLKGEEYDVAFDEISAVDVKVGILASSMPKDELQDEKHNQDSVASRD
ncbi:serine/threonine-protein kinase WNK (With NoLysine)-related [Striga asiatica]|uniref:Serine/threonine-protein kinase WNK (With NoLysine)-related n=1 Tax=Striga asiatica TaxID=4170 RepID=A0A5A7Q815_STRAF|nr:serine/threonine-protein kinase WNK (With NoLysine)-related [Striga asiatica]